MLVFTVVPPEVKPFMSKLLREEVFDRFETRGVDIAAVTRFQLSGALIPDFAEGEAAADRRFCTWRELRPYVYNIVKGGRQPKQMKITLALAAENLPILHENASACFLNITFEDGEVRLATGTSEKNFTMDGSVAAAWDDYARRFLKKHGVAAEEQKT